MDTGPNLSPVTHRWGVQALLTLDSLDSSLSSILFVFTLLFTPAPAHILDKQKQKSFYYRKIVSDFVLSASIFLYLLFMVM